MREIARPADTGSTAGAGAPTREQIQQLLDAEAGVQYKLVEAAMRRIAQLLLSYRPELQVLFIGGDGCEAGYEPVGVSVDRELRDPAAEDSLEEYEQIEIAAGHEGELANLVNELSGFEYAFYPYTVDHRRIRARYSLDLHAMLSASVKPPQEPRWWTVIGTWARDPVRAPRAWTEHVHAATADAAARTAVSNRREDLAALRDLFATEHEREQADPRAYAVLPGAGPITYQQ